MQRPGSRWPVGIHRRRRSTASGPWPSWARALLALEENWAARAAVFQALKCGLDGSDEVEPYAAIAARLGMTEGAVKTAAYDLRKGFAAQVRREIRSTVASDEDVEQELRYLVQLIQR